MSGAETDDKVHNCGRVVLCRKVGDRGDKAFTGDARCHVEVEIGV
jgi:hypothetical protein